MLEQKAYRPRRRTDRGKAWRKNARKATLRFDDGVISLRQGGRTVWSVEVGEGSGQAAMCLRAAGHLHGASIDYYVLVDSEGAQVSPPLRRAAAGAAPEAAWWPLCEMREFMSGAGIRLKDRVFGSARDLEEALPELAAHHRSAGG